MKRLTADEFHEICEQVNERYSIIMAAGGITLQRVIAEGQGEPKGAYWFDPLTHCYVPVALSGFNYATV